LAFTHVPLLNKLFQSAPIDASAWLWIVAVGAGVLVLVEIEKTVRRLFHSHEDV
ncbi:MAG: cation transporting ATPase C-terminal domain-containing protein, partial [Phycisphaerales bacterium]